MSSPIVPHVALRLRVITSESLYAVGDGVLLIVALRLIVWLWLWWLIVDRRLVVRSWRKDRSSKDSTDHTADDTSGKTTTAAAVMMAILCLGRDARG